MNHQHEDTEDTSSTTRLNQRRPPTRPLRRVVGYGVGGAVGGGVFALIQYLGPGLLMKPRVIRWVVLYALLGGVGGTLWREATRWATARFSLSRRDAGLVSGLVAGTLAGAAALFVAALNQGVGGDGLLLLRLPWNAGVGGFVGGAIAGGGWRYFFNEIWF